LCVVGADAYIRPFILHYVYHQVIINLIHDSTLSLRLSFSARAENETKEHAVQKERWLIRGYTISEIC